MTGPYDDLVVLDLPARQEWVDDALCAQTDPEAFYPEKGGPAKAAKDICRQCPVIEQCLEWALEHGDRYGIWGGKSERERRKILRSRGRDLAAERKAALADRNNLIHQLTADGVPADQVAARLGISTNTVWTIRRTA